MKELSLHILDIAQNSITADATLVEIEIVEDTKKDILTITVKDNGKGMSEDFL
ncbi:MAG: ATP-binding protein [Clostridia bacterium]|nr:ATP-binding protein [Clostridia bacterium]